MPQDTRVRLLLESLDLSEYQDAFDANGIVFSHLKSLTNDDLKELGLSSMGQRKALLAAIQHSELALEAASTAATVPSSSPADESMSARGASTEEHCFLEKTFPLANGEVASVKITSRRAILGDKTYALQNIAAVEAYSNVAEVENLNRNALAAWEEKNGIGMTVGGLSIAAGSAIIGLLMAITPDAQGGHSGAPVSVCCFAPAAFFVWSAFKKTDRPAPLQPHWAVRIQASGTANDVVASFNKADIEEIVAALNQAIVNLIM
jgi:hypothetical protein